jgi:hypothetical protein
VCGLALDPGGSKSQEPERPEAAKGIDRMIQEGKKTGMGRYGCSSSAFKDEIGYSVRVHIDRTVMVV